MENAWHFALFSLQLCMGKKKMMMMMTGVLKTLAGT